ncbi:MAG: hypothetical protein KGI71_02845, partial [Patescibacteria group bacterium]|nr:hypothetical protein [Patescibacteria group bacterium]
MIRKPIAVFLLLLMMVGSSVFFIAPQKTYAQSIIGAAAGAGAAGAAQCYLSSALSSLLGSAPSAITSVPVFDTANLSVNTTAAGSTLESCIFNTVLVPIARAIARAILQQITASTINWINGSNGTGQPSYIQNLAVHLQGVGDSFAVPFIAQIRSNAFNSPFSSAIAAALSNNYAQQTSVQGFYAQ